jgi:hypothetical protein
MCSCITHSNCSTVVQVVHWGVSLPLLFISKWVRDYNEGNRVGYNMIIIMTLYLLIYFTYIFTDIFIQTPMIL